VSEDPNSIAAAAAPRWQRRPEARPEEILDAALEVFGEYGFAQTKLEEVARRAGVSKGTLYLYFDSKEELFREMVQAKAVSALRVAEAFAESYQGSNRDLLVELLERKYVMMRDQQLSRISKLVQSELQRFPELAQFYVQEVILPARRLVESILRRGIAAGEFRPTLHAFATRALPMLMIQATQTQCFFQQFDPEALTDDQTIEGLIDFVLHGVLARPEPAR
jgi:AcrR family transcriptional regulator